MGNKIRWQILSAVGNELLLITRPRQHQENVYKTNDTTVTIYSVDLDPVAWIINLRSITLFFFLDEMLVHYTEGHHSRMNSSRAPGFRSAIGNEVAFLKKRGGK